MSNPFELPGDVPANEPTVKPEVKPELSADQKAEKERQGLPSSVEVEIASAPMELQQPIVADESGGFIKYIGVGTVRQMTPADWERVGVDDFNRFIEWNGLNKMCVPRSIFTDKALQYLLNDDRRFIVVSERPKSKLK
jgi:hypothetical protein